LRAAPLPAQQLMLIINSIINRHPFKDKPDLAANFVRQLICTLSYGREKIGGNVKFPARLFPYFSIGYLVKRDGSLYDKNTFRPGVGCLSR
jgi:hypothetical protein